MDLSPEEGFLSASKATGPPVPGQVPGVSQGGVCGAATGILRKSSRAEPSSLLRRLGRILETEGMGGLCKAPFWWARASTPLSSAVHPPRSDFQWATARPGRRPRAFPVARFPTRQSDQGDIPGRGGVHPALPPPRASLWLCEDPPFRLSVEPQAQSHGSTVPRTPIGLSSTTCHDRAPRRSLPFLQNRPPPCDRMAICSVTAPQRSTASATAVGLVIEPMSVAFPIIRSRRSPTGDARRGAPPCTNWMRKTPVSHSSTAKSAHSAHRTALEIIGSTPTSHWHISKHAGNQSP
jgi:hypothetical protein